MLDIKILSGDGSLRLGGGLSSLHFDNITRKPWQLQKDGDLWQNLNESVTRKGPPAIRLTKIKAHTKRGDVDSGLITHEHREGNLEADAAAGRGGGRESEAET